MKARPFRLLSDAALLALLVAPLTGPATAAEYTTLAYGGITCEAWSNARAGKAQDAAVYEAWILGFLSAYNAFVFKGPNVAAGSDFNALRSMVDDHCKERPKDDLDSAAQALIKQLLAKNPPQ